MSGIYKIYQKILERHLIVKENKDYILALLYAMVIKEVQKIKTNLLLIQKFLMLLN